MKSFKSVLVILFMCYSSILFALDVPLYVIHQRAIQDATEVHNKQGDTFDLVIPKDSALAKEFHHKHNFCK